MPTSAESRLSFWEAHAVPQELSDASGLGPWPSLIGHHVEILNEVHAGGIIQDVRVTSKGHMNIRVQESPAKVVTVRTQYEDV